MADNSCSSTLACFLRFLFLCIAYSYGTLAFSEAGNKVTTPIPDFVNAFNPSFWVLIELWLGSWASNLITFGPLLTRGWLGRRTKQTYGATARSTDDPLKSYKDQRRSIKPRTGLENELDEFDFAELGSDDGLGRAKEASAVDLTRGPDKV